MKLVTSDIKAKLVKNHAKQQENINRDGKTDDLYPVVKLFYPLSAATWLLTELDPETNVAFGLCDLGFGSPELGNVSLTELESVKPHGVGVERDMYWKAKHPLSVYAEKAREANRIEA